MKISQVVFSSVVLWQALLCTGLNAVTIKLSALRPDLEYFRGTWLQNPPNNDIHGRIIFSNKTEVVVNSEQASDSDGASEYCPSDVDVGRWRQGSLLLENLNTSVESLFYKHGSFYLRRYPCDMPEALDKDSWVEMLPLKLENDLKESIEVRYISLKTLGKEIEQEVSRVDSELTGLEGLILKSTKRSLLTVFVEDNQFSFEYERAHRFVDVHHVRTIQFPPKSGDFDEDVLLYRGPQHFVDFAVTRDYSYIRYDRRVKSFLSPRNEQLDSRWVVRSNVGNYVLRVGAGSEFRTVCIPPKLCRGKNALSDETKTAMRRNILLDV